MKKLIALTLALVMVLSLCVACGGGATGETSGNKGGQTGEAGEQIKLTIGLPTKATVLSYEDNALTKWLEEQTGYDLTFVPYSGGTDIGTQISTTVAAQQPLPDILYGINLGDSVVNGYGRDGYFIDLAPYYEDREGASKTFWTRLEENFTEAEQANILRLLKEPETGAMYSVPTLETSLIDIMDYQMWINVEWLDKLGLEKPTNTDELYNVLKAFKTQDPNGNGQADELPLYGGQDAGLCADVVNWLINMFLYFNDRKHFSIDAEGQLYAPFTTDEYREALKYVNKLIDEGLMLDSVLNTKMNEMQMITTPASGTPVVGIFAGHLTLHVSIDNPLLYQYEPLPLWGNAVYNDNTNSRGNHITADCANPDAAWNLIMEMRKEESSNRIRYGEYGVNWKEAPEGAVSDYGIPAKIMIIEDPFNTQNTCLWSGATGSLNVWAEGEAAQLTTELNEWGKKKSEMHAESRRLFDEAAAKYNPPAEQICPTLVYTEDEKEETESIRTACADYYQKSRTDFCVGKLDPNSESDWETYLKTLDDLGLESWLELAQIAFERQ